MRPMLAKSLLLFQQSMQSNDSSKKLVYVKAAIEMMVKFIGLQRDIDFYMFDRSIRKILAELQQQGVDRTLCTKAYVLQDISLVFDSVGYSTLCDLYLNLYNLTTGRNLHEEADSTAVALECCYA